MSSPIWWSCNPSSAAIHPSVRPHASPHIRLSSCETTKRMDETRRAPRRRVLKAGSITVGGGAIDCVVRNLSATGAALQVSRRWASRIGSR